MALFVRRLTHLDVSLWCPDRGLIGASWLVDVELDGELGEDGMLFDFGPARRLLKRAIDERLDHLTGERSGKFASFQLGRDTAQLCLGHSLFGLAQFDIEGTDVAHLGEPLVNLTLSSGRIETG